MKEYEILEHTTDLEIRAFGKTKGELFSNMLKGMFFGAGAKAIKGEKITRKIKVKAADAPSLLVDFLNEALTLSDINNEAYFEAKFGELGENELEGEIIGSPIKSLGVEIKAVTYHGVEIKKVDDMWQAIVLFDI